MAHNPLEQFKVKPIIDIEVFGYDISFTNSALFMVLTAVFIIGYFIISFRGNKLVPNRLQMSAELCYKLIANMVGQNVGDKGKRYVPLMFTIFLFILIANLFGMLPYGFTVTSHISITFVLAMLVFLLVTILGFVLHGFHFLSLFLPKGTPWWLAPLMILIELFAYLARPVSLSLRLAANMVAGHVLMKVMAGFVLSMTIILNFLPAAFIVVFTGFEIFVAILQAYIFTILSCVYLNDAINLH